MSETQPENSETGQVKPKRTRIWRWLGWFVLVLILLVAGLLAWSLGTNAGARTVLTQALPANISVGEVTGRLWGPLGLRAVRVDDAAVVVQIEHVDLRWQPQELMSKKLKINKLTVQGLTVQLLPTPDAAPSEPAAMPANIATPIDIVLDALLLVDVQVEQSGSTYAVDQVLLQASWVGERLDVQSLEVVAGDASIAVQGDAQLAGEYPIQVTAEINALQPSALQASWPELRIDATAEAQGPLLDPQGMVQLSALLPEQPEPITLQLAGGGQGYEFVGQARWQRGSNSLPIKLVGTGTREEVQVERLQLGVEQDPAMQLVLRGGLSWVDGINGTFVLDGDGVNPATFADEIASAADNVPSGNLKVGARVKFKTAANDELRVAVDDLLVDGMLGTLPLHVAGGVMWSPQKLQIDGLQGTLGSDQVRWQVQGGVAEKNNLTWSFEATGLDEVSTALGLAPQDRVQGQIQGRGQIRGTRANPKIVAKIEGSSLAYQEQKIDSLQVNLQGTQRAHDLTLALSAPQGQVDLALTGDLDADGRWKFLASQLNLATVLAEQPQVWHLRKPTKGWVHQGKFELQQACFAQIEPSGGSGLCLSAGNPGANVVADVEVTALDLQIVNYWMPPQVRLRGLLAGTAHWGGEPMLSRGEFQLDGLAVAVQNAERWQDVLEFDSAQAQVTSEAKGLALQVDLPIGSDGLHLKSLIDGVAIRSTELSPTAWPIQGELQIRLPELAWVAAFSPEIELTDASLNGQLAVGGLLGSPTLDGEAQLQIASLLLNTPGITLEQTKLQVNGTDAGLQFQGTTNTSGEPVALTADVSWQGGLQARGSLRGDNLLVSDSDTALVRVSPDLTFAFKDKLVKVRGRVAVPTADIRLRQAPAGAISVTPDQVLVNTQEAVEAEPAVAVDARIEIELGDEVRFAGLGLEAQFGGKLKIQQEPNRLARGTGEIQIKEGSYTAYGQDLSIENGRLIFAGGPLTEPGLDVRAVRQATPEVLVGVNVRGSLAEPKLTLFSTPSLPESDQLSYLVLGRPMSGGSASERSMLEQAALALGVKGGKLITDRLGKSLAVDNIGIESAPGEDNDQAALVIGKYLSPKLYVSYGYGLFEPISTLRLEYQLSRLWRIVTESTNEAAGGDLEWVLEK